MDGYLFIFFLINYNCNEKNIITNLKYNKINHMYLYDDNCNVEKILYEFQSGSTPWITFFFFFLVERFSGSHQVFVVFPIVLTISINCMFSPRPLYYLLILGNHTILVELFFLLWRYQFIFSCKNPLVGYNHSIFFK